MEIIIADPNGMELEQLGNQVGLDFELGSTNDFQFTVSLDEWDTNKYGFGNRIYIPHTEYGGEIGDIQPNTKQNTVIVTGDTWRGMLSKKIIRPPDGEDYKIISGELNTIIKELMEPVFPGLFFVSEVNTGVTVTNFQFDRYCTLLSGIEKILESVNYRLSIRYMQGDPGGGGYVEVSAVPIKDYSEESEYNQDGKINFTCRDYRRGYNHLICLGKGELKDRLVLDLYVQKDGSIGTTKYYVGTDERETIYDFSSEEDQDKLKESGTAKLKELMNYKQFQLDIEDIDLNIGDTVAGCEQITGIYVKKSIIQKILRISNGMGTVEYKFKGDD